MASGPYEGGEPPPLPRPTHDPSWRDRLERALEGVISQLEGVNAPRLILTLAVVAGTTAGVWWLILPSNSTAPLEDSLPTRSPLVEPSAGPPADNATIVVHVAGAVERPGLVQVPNGSRVADAVAAAGGATGVADVDRLNLALEVGDADRVYVPEEGEVVTADLLEPALGETPALVDLNTATATELQTLPGVGPAIAAAIIEHRQSRGTFSSVASLENVRGIGPAKLERLRELVTVSS